MPNDIKDDTVDKTVDSNKSNTSSKPWVVVLVVLLIITILASCGMLFMRFRHRALLGDTRVGMIQVDRGFGMRGRHTILVNSTSNSTSNTIIAEGVVTSVDNDSFIIAGNGSQTTVKTSGSTTYNTTDKKVSKNDSVVVTGTKSDSTITASDIRIVNF